MNQLLRGRRIIVKYYYWMNMYKIFFNNVYKMNLYLYIFMSIYIIFYIIFKKLYLKIYIKQKKL